MADPGGGAALLAEAAGGDRRALARLLTMVERGGASAAEVARGAQSTAGRTYSVGLTGAPGAGKSTLTARLVALARGDGARVAVLAVDPSSPFTGGAILGDRVRMGEHAGDEGVFIRSMASRGHLGGLALAVPEAVRVLDAAGFGWTFLETVGVGQVEVEVAGQADTTVVVVNPGWGDAVQAAKAGLMEIADVFVVNKADRPGGGETRRDLEAVLDLAEPGPWRPPVVETCAETGAGCAELWQAIGEHRAHLEATGELAARRARRRRAQLDAIVRLRVEEEARDRAADVDRDEVERAVAAGELDPWTAADRLLGRGA